MSIGYLAAMLGLLLTFSGCEVVGGIFKAGVWVGVILVVVVIFIVIRLLSGGGGNRS